MKKMLFQLFDNAVYAKPSKLDKVAMAIIAPILILVTIYGKEINAWIDSLSS